VLLLAVVACTCGSSLLFAQALNGSPTTSENSTPPSLTPMQLLSEADLLLTNLIEASRKQSERIESLRIDLAKLNEQLIASEFSSLMLAEQLTVSLEALRISEQEQERLKASLAALRRSYAEQSLALQAVRDAAAQLQADSMSALIAERSKLLPWQIGCGVAVAVAIAAVVYGATRK
jgi:hypothetical protein